MIQRKAGKTMKDYVKRYEPMAWKCKGEGDGELPEPYILIHPEE